jgi:hypothetical protein
MFWPLAIKEKETVGELTVKETEKKLLDSEIY